MAIKNDSEKYKEQIQKLETKISELNFEAEQYKSILKEETDNRKFYQLIADFTFGWEIWLDPKGVLKYCSPSCFDITGFTSNQIFSIESISNLLLYPPDQNKFATFIDNSLNQTIAAKSIEFRILTRTKQLRWCNINVRGVYDKKGKYLGVRASIQDITSLKRAMSHIQGLEKGKEFEHRTVQRLQSTLDLKDRELVSFLLELSHKNELLVKISNYLKNLGDDNPSLILSKISEINTLVESSSIQQFDWAILENQLEKIHPGFLTRLILKHPLITQKDRKLCAYLILKLSSKEIAGLLNITPKSVEIARVRLRKKLKLSSKVRLVNYLLQV